MTKHSPKKCENILTPKLFVKVNVPDLKRKTPSGTSKKEGHRRKVRRDEGLGQ